MSESGQEINVQRSLGRIEGAQKQILDKMDDMVQALSDHAKSDEIIVASIRDAMALKAREQDERITDLEREANTAKGAGWVIIGLLGSLAAFLGGAVMAVLNGWITVKFH